MNLNEKKILRFNKSKKYLLVYDNIELKKVWEYYHGKLAKEEIIDIAPANQQNMVKVLINLSNPLQLHTNHRLVVIEDTNSPVFIKNFPRKTNTKNIINYGRCNFFKFYFINLCL